MSSQRGGVMTAAIEGPARDAQRTQQAILHAAQPIFAEKGYPAATERDITARAGVDPSTVRRYFGRNHTEFDAALAHPRATRENGERTARDTVGRKVDKP